MEIAGLKGFTLYAKSDKLNGILHSFLKGNDKKLGPVLFSYAAKIFYIRYHGYTIVPLPENDFDGDFLPAKEIFGPFRFKVVDPFVEDVIEEGENIRVHTHIKRGISLGEKVMLFGMKPNAKEVEKAAKLLRKNGAKTLICFFLSEA